MGLRRRATLVRRTGMARSTSGTVPSPIPDVTHPPIPPCPLQSRGAIHRRVLALALVLLAGCEPGPEIARDDVMAFYRAAHYGDVQGQLQALARKEEQTEHGGRVVRAMFLEHLMRRFAPDSAELVEVRGDTALWIVWGTEPDYRADDNSAGTYVDTAPREPTLDEADAGPRVRAQQGVELVRGEDGWKLRLDADRLGPVFAQLDSIDARCPFGKDARPCREPAERLRRSFQALPARYHQRFGHVDTHARRTIQTAQAMDSIRLELLGEYEDRYGGGMYSYFDVAVLNRSSIRVGSVYFRVVDADGSVVQEHGFVQNLPPRGRAEERIQVSGRSFPRPVRLELAFVVLPYDDP